MSPTAGKVYRKTGETHKTEQNIHRAGGIAAPAQNSAHTGPQIVSGWVGVLTRPAGAVTFRPLRRRTQGFQQRDRTMTQNDTTRLNATPTMQAVNPSELENVEGGGFWGRLAESVGRLAEGVGVVTGSPLL